MPIFAVAKTRQGEAYITKAEILNLYDLQQSVTERAMPGGRLYIRKIIFMRFYLYLLLGFLGGIPAGMGMGGGTVTIPLLLLFGGVQQKIAQSANLFAFLPAGACALSVHVKNNLLQKNNAVKNAIPALIAAAAGSFFALALPAAFLRKTFGLFLVLLAVFTLAKNKA